MNTVTGVTFSTDELAVLRATRINDDPGVVELRNTMNEALRQFEGAKRRWVDDLDEMVAQAQAAKATYIVATEAFEARVKQVGEAFDARTRALLAGADSDQGTTTLPATRLPFTRESSVERARRSLEGF